MKHKSLFVVIFLSVICFTSALQSQITFYSQSFESDSNSNLIPDPFSLGGTNTSFFNWATDQAQEGSRSIKFSDTSSTDYVQLYMISPTENLSSQYVTGGSTFNFSFYERHDATTVESYGMIRFFDSAGTAISNQTVNISSTLPLNTWNLISTNVTTPTNTAYYTLVFSSQASGVGTTWFDNAILSVPEPSTYFMIMISCVLLGILLKIKRTNTY